MMVQRLSLFHDGAARAALQSPCTNIIRHVLQHWAKISASGATGIEDLNNSTLQFTDVNGSSLSGTTSEVVKQMVAACVSAAVPRFPSLTHHLSVTQVGVIGENLVLRRCASLHVPQGLVLPYVHNSMAPGMGSIGVLLGTPPSLCFLREIWWLNLRAIVIVLQVCRTCTN